MNLLTIPWIDALLKSRWYPAVFQWAVAVVFALILYVGLAGPVNPGQSFTLAATWVLWWPVIPLSFFLAGRLWCAVCPFGWLSDLMQRFAGVEQSVPHFLRKYGLWIIDASFILITWSDHILGIVGSPRGSAYLLLIMAAGAIFMGAIFERRAFCRYVCFIGGLSGNYSRAGLLAVRATPEICRACTTKSCYRGNDTVPGCPMSLFPKMMEDQTKCTLCANCVKACPSGSIRVMLRKPTSELWFIRKPKLEEVFLACVIMGIVLVQNVTMLSIWSNLLAGVEEALHTTNYPLAFTVIFAGFMAMPVLGMVLAGALSGLLTGAVNRAQVMRNFMLFGYGIIPLDLAAHMAHNFFHLLTELRAVGYTFLSLFGVFTSNNAALAPSLVVFPIQMVVLALGTAGSLYVAYRIARRGYPQRTWAAYVPQAAFLLLVLCINIYAFTLPMYHRM